MYGPDGAGAASSPSSSITAGAVVAPCSTKILIDEAETRPLGATRRRIETMLRWMSSTSVTGEPPLTTLPIHFSSSTSTTRRNSSAPPSKYLRSPGLHCESASRSLLSILVPKKRAQVLSSFMDHPAANHERAAWFGPRFGDKDSNLDTQLQRLLSYH